MTLQPHIFALVWSCNWQRRRISQLKKYITTEAAEKLIHAFISSRLDTGNSLLFSLPEYQIHRLQRVHNTAARILTLTRKYDHITPILESLHWLPVQSRITFKLLTLTYRCLNGLAPSYLSELLYPYTPARSLRSSNLLLLTIPKTKTKGYGDRAFQNAAPKLWNNLPLSIRQAGTLSSFKQKLKCHLFKESFKRTWTFHGRLRFTNDYCIVLYCICLQWDIRCAILEMIMFNVQFIAQLCMYIYMRMSM